MGGVGIVGGVADHGIKGNETYFCDHVAFKGYFIESDEFVDANPYYEAALSKK